MEMLYIIADNIINERYYGDFSLRNTVVKCLIHDTLFYSLKKSGLLKHIVFQGGTALQRVYSSSRLSEDLDFCCKNIKRFSIKEFTELGNEFANIVNLTLSKEYSLNESAIRIIHPKDIKKFFQNDVEKYSIIIDINYKRSKKLRINIEICNIPSYENSKKIMQTFYGIKNNLDDGLFLIQVESLREIFMDKVIALANRAFCKYRDIYDIFWLNEQYKIQNLDIDLLLKKINDYQISYVELLNKSNIKINMIKNSDYLTDFKKEISRFISLDYVDNMIKFGKANQMINFSLNIL